MRSVQQWRLLDKSCFAVGMWCHSPLCLQDNQSSIDLGSLGGWMDRPGNH